MCTDPVAQTALNMAVLAALERVDAEAYADGIASLEWRLGLSSVPPRDPDAEAAWYAELHQHLAPLDDGANAAHVHVLTAAQEAARRLGLDVRVIELDALLREALNRR